MLRGHLRAMLVRRCISNHTQNVKLTASFYNQVHLLAPDGRYALLQFVPEARNAHPRPVLQMHFVIGDGSNIRYLQV